MVLMCSRGATDSAQSVGLECCRLEPHRGGLCDSLGSLGGRQSALKVPVEGKSILESQDRERWMVVQGIWLAPTWETVFCEQAWEGVGKGTLTEGPAASRCAGVRLRLEAPVRFAMGWT